MKYGIINDALSWFLSYLSARTQCTLCNNSMSSFQTVTSGVPQGSLLGPKLFLSFINDLPKFVQNCNLYADDTEIEVVGKTVNEVVSSLQTQIDNLNIWFKHNRLTVNASKSCSMLIGSRQKIGNDASRSSLGLFLNGEPINNQTTYNYLGLTIDCFLSFDVMIDNICNKLKCRVAMIQRIRYFLSSHHLSSHYYAFIQPFIDYCILIWGHSFASNLNRIQKLQNRAARIITNSYDFNISGLTIVKDLNWLNVSQRRDYINNLLIYKCLYCDAPNYLLDQLSIMCEVSSRDTRQSDDHSLLVVPFSKTSYFKRSFSVYGPSCWNSLPTQIRLCKSYILNYSDA